MKPEMPTPNQLAPQVSFRTEGSWHFVAGFPEMNQGWKLYISATVMTASACIEKLVPFLSKLGIPHKYLISLEEVSRMNSGSLGYSQIGKILVIYLEDHDLSFIKILKLLLKKFKDGGPQIPFAMAIGGRLPMYYRYGSYKGDEITIDGNTKKDRRDSKEHAVPKGIKDPFTPYLEEPLIDKAAEDFFSRYIASTALSQTGKGGVFRGFDIEKNDYKPLLIKVGYLKGAVLKGGVDGQALMRNEIRCYHLLGELGCARLVPKMRAYLDTERSAAIVTDYIWGPNLLSLLKNNLLTTSHLSAAWDIMKKLHQKDILLGDSKLGNFVICLTTTNVFCIDLEVAGMASENTYQEIRTFRITNAKSGDPKHLDLLHFLASVVFPISETCPFLNRHLDLARIRSLAEGLDCPQIREWVFQKLNKLV